MLPGIIASTWAGQTEALLHSDSGAPWLAGVAPKENILCCIEPGLPESNVFYISGSGSGSYFKTCYFYRFIFFTDLDFFTDLKITDLTK